MTHSLFRNSELKELKQDFPWLAYPVKGVNSEGYASKAVKFIDLAEKNNVNSWGIQDVGNNHSHKKEDIIPHIHDNSHLAGVFSSSEDLRGFIQDVLKEDMGISLTVVGDLNELNKVFEDTGTQPHTINYSFGIWGNVEVLKEKEPVLPITTMCGHSMVSSEIVEKLVEKVKNGKSSAKRAAKILSELCPCGIFNTNACEKIIEKECK